MYKEERNIRLDMKCLHGFKIIPDTSSLEVIGSRLNKLGEGGMNSPIGKTEVDLAAQRFAKS